MPKMKTNRAAAKRFKQRGSGSLKRQHSGMNHFLRRKNKKSKRHLRQTGEVSPQDEKRMKRVLGKA